MSTAIALSKPYTALARTISDTCSPPIMAIPGLAVAAIATRAPGAWLYATLYFVLAVLTPVLYVVWLVRCGRVADFHLPDRCDRVRPFLASLLCGLGAVMLLIQLGAPSTFVGPLWALLLQTLVLFLITLSWQISIHTATVAGVITFAVLAFGPQLAILYLLVPVVAWARIYLGRHTLAQTIAGMGVGCASFLTLFALRGVVW